MSSKYIELRRETGDPGTEAAVSASFAAKTLFVPGGEFSFDPNVAPLNRDDEMRGVNEPLSEVPESFAPAWSLSTRIYPDVFAFLVSLMFGAPTTVAGDGIITDLDSVAVPVGAHRHRWTSPYSVSGTPPTAMARIGMPDESIFWGLRGMTLQGLEIASPDAGGVMLTANGLANYVDDISDPSLTPTYESLAIQPFLRQSADLDWLTGSAVTETISWSIADAKDHTRTFGGQSKSPNLVEYAEGVPELQFSIDKRAVDADDWAALVSGTRFTVLSRWEHTTAIASGYPYKVHIQGPSSSAAYRGGGGVTAQNRRRTPMQFTGRLSRESAASSVIEVVNSVASYA